jgi:hypothetical protein
MAKYIKPTLRTKFHIDFQWWADEGRNFRRALLDQLCDECREAVENDPEPRSMDWIDPDTAQVFAIDQLWHVLNTQCAHKPEFLNEDMPLTASIFRLFIANNNRPLTPSEIHQQLRTKSAHTILRTVGGRNVYKGIRPLVPLLS